ncbi:MFS monocarboxylate transporter [Rhodofomes roseus]|uniref:MFS monocarboxylate transporter n=1 Tax=Rhodofomes roseus TaxID=34475 RepID=A0ABQ8KLN1_9APHY|nr:MFS monocarboxylate transporter [Rhodofomes roseus]KAH9838541.1 MFS monocarboxylate transporter [Rhodofomes roseus]
MPLPTEQRAPTPDGDLDEALVEGKNAAQIQLGPQSPPAITLTFPEGGLRAWSNVIGCFLLAFTSFGQLNAFGVFQTYYAENLLQDYTLSSISWIGSVQLVITYISGIILGRVFDIYGARSSLVIGWILSTFSLMMTSLSRKYYQIVLAQGIGLGIGIALQYMTVPTHWFRAKRAAAMGIVVSGASLSGIIYPIMLSRLFDSVGFPWAVRIMAFMNFGIQAVAIPLVKERLPHRLGLPLVDVGAFREGTFLLHIIAGFLAPFGLYTPYWYIELFSLSTGLSANLSFYMIAIMNAAGLVGRVLTGYLGDRYGRFNVTVPILVLGAISSMAIWTTSKGAAETVVFSRMEAAYSSISASATAQITPDPTQIGARIGMFMTAMAPGILTGPSISGAILQHNGGNYLGLQIFVGVMLLAAAGAESAARLYGAPQLFCIF